MIKVFIVNLDADVERYQEISVHLEKTVNLNVRRIRAVPGSSLASTACDILTKTSGYNVGKGALGCFLSHLHVWEIASSLDDPFVVILEDDARLRDLEIFAKLTLPDDADLVFCHDQLVPGDGSAAADITFLEIEAGLVELVRSGSKAVGAFGYVLTPRGARLLVEAVRQDGCFGHVDWRLLRYSVTETLVDQFIPNSEVATVLKTHHCWDKPAWGILRTYILSPAAVDHLWSESARVREDEN